MPEQGGLESREKLRYRAGFREELVQTVAQWIIRQKSGVLVGLSGAGKSNFVQFLCEEREHIRPYFPPHLPNIALVPVDLNNLVDFSLATLYRVILRAFYYHRAYFPQNIVELVIRFYEEVKVVQDPFVSQSALYDLLFAFQDMDWRILLILDRFDAFTEGASPELTNTLRGLRDSFKETLGFIMVMRQEAIYLPNPAELGELIELIDTYVCWVGAMSVPDATHFVQRELRFAAQQPDEEAVQLMLTLSGRFAAVLKAVCAWWLDEGFARRPAEAEWSDALGVYQPVQYRLKEIWDGLNQEERYVLSCLQIGKPLPTTPHSEVLLPRLMVKGVCRRAGSKLEINGRLLAQYVGSVIGEGLGRIWKDKKTGLIYQGNQELEDLRPLEQSMLQFFIENPYRQHSKTDLINSIWPEDVQREGVTDDSLYQIVRGLRKKIEPIPSKPTYVVNRRGWPESKYQFFPEGQPNPTYEKL